MTQSEEAGGKVTHLLWLSAGNEFYCNCARERKTLAEANAKQPSKIGKTFSTQPQLIVPVKIQICWLKKKNLVLERVTLGHWKKCTINEFIHIWINECLYSGENFQYKVYTMWW